MGCSCASMTTAATTATVTARAIMILVDKSSFIGFGGATNQSSTGLIMDLTRMPPLVFTGLLYITSI